jgi:hypothetical protein
VVSLLSFSLVARAVSLETLGLEVSRVSTNFPVSGLDTFSSSIETFDTEKKKSTIKTYPIKINRKLRVAKKIGSTFFWFLTNYRAAEIVQNDFFIISMKFPIHRIPSCLTQ